MPKVGIIEEYIFTYKGGILYHNIRTEVSFLSFLHVGPVFSCFLRLFPRLSYSRNFNTSKSELKNQLKYRLLPKTKIMVKSYLKKSIKSRKL